jgi:GDPmannose 4,6-dehydratase
MSARRALITGIAGQDGSLLAELLLEHGYQVFGSVRGDPHDQYENLNSVHGRVELISLDLLDRRSVSHAFAACAPHEVYNLASVSFSPASWGSRCTRRE